MKTYLNSEAVLETYKARGAALTLREIGQLFGLSGSAVWRILDKAGIRKDWPVPSVERIQSREAERKTKRDAVRADAAEQKQQLQDERSRAAEQEHVRRQERDAAILEACADAALSLPEIGQRFGLSRQHITRIMRRAGLPHRKRGARPGHGCGMKPGSQKPERDAEVLRLRNSGMTLRAIGKQLGLSGERIGRIAKRAGSTFVRSKRDCQQRNNEIRQKVALLPVVVSRRARGGVDAIAREYGLSREMVYAIVKGTR